MTRADLPEDLRGRVAVGVPEVAKLLGVSVSLVRGEIRAGRLAARQVGDGSERVKFIIPVDALIAWLPAPAQEETRR